MENCVFAAIAIPITWRHQSRRNHRWQNIVWNVCTKKLYLTAYQQHKYRNTVLLDDGKTLWFKLASNRKNHFKLPFSLVISKRGSVWILWCYFRWPEKREALEMKCMPFKRSLIKETVIGGNIDYLSKISPCDGFRLSWYRYRRIPIKQENITFICYLLYLVSSLSAHFFLLLPQ